MVTAPAGAKGPESRCGLPGRCHWYTCPRSQWCTESHPGQSFVPMTDTWVCSGWQGHCTMKAIHNNIPGTEHHCRLNTAGLESLPHPEGSPEAEKKSHRHIARWAGPAQSWASFPKSHESRPHLLLYESHFISLIFFFNFKTESSLWNSIGTSLITEGITSFILIIFPLR